jgi:ubiquinone/menaquinone biosynthesis C-methylase UbiE
MPTESIAFDRAADFYDETRGFPDGVETQVAEVIARTGGLDAKSRVLEIGVGTGRIATPLSRSVGLMNGADLSLAMMQRLRRKVGSERIRLVQADAAKLPYQKQAFDTVFVVHVFHLVADLDGVLQQIARVLKPDGHLLFCWNSHAEEDTIFSELRKVWRETLGAEAEQRWDRTPEFLEKAGWTLEDEQTHSYTFSNWSPAWFADSFRRRIWSATWRMSDEAIQQGVAAMKAAIDQKVDDPTQIIDVPNTFHVLRFRRSNS